MMWWRHKGECATLCGKGSNKYLKSLKKHEIKIKFICFTYKIEIYFIREHQLFYFHSWLRHSWKYCIWCSLSEIIFQSYMKKKKQISSIYCWLQKWHKQNTVALLSRHIIFTSLVSLVYIQVCIRLSLQGKHQWKHIFFNLISGPSLMDTAYHKYNYAKMIYKTFRIITTVQ
jgi:hypothetical protein